jgi:hypothetical protein
MATVDITVTEDDETPGGMLLHTPGCPMVQAHREAGRQLCTMFGCQVPLPDMKGTRLHTCLNPERTT